MNSKKYAEYEKRMLPIMEEGKAWAEAGLGKDGIDKYQDISRRNAWLIGWRNGGGNILTGKVRPATGAPHAK